MIILVCPAHFLPAGVLRKEIGLIKCIIVMTEDKVRWRQHSHLNSPVEMYVVLFSNEPLGLSSMTVAYMRVVHSLHFRCKHYCFFLTSVVTDHVHAFVYILM